MASALTLALGACASKRGTGTTHVLWDGDRADKREQQEETAVPEGSGERLPSN
jgi:hypothetical protein